MRAEKGNKQYTIDETQRAFYAKEGFDIYDDEGKLIQNGAGKTVPFERYQAALDHIAELEAAAAAPDKKNKKE